MTTATAHSSDAARARVGTTIDGLWQVDALVAVGGSATIYAATDGRGKRYAVKIFDVDLADVPSALAHFRAEGRVANRIGHPGVVNILAEGTTEDGAPYLVMPLLEGETAQQRLQRHPGGLPAREALAIVEAVLDVLVAAHGRGIVHRDLKPDNVFLERGGGVRVLDFGIARLADNPDRTMHGTVLGTPGYLPPEQARGKIDEVGPRSDLWTVGALLYTLLTGRVLHEAPTLIASVLRAQNDVLPPAKQLVPGIGNALAHALDGALAFDPAQRWMEAGVMLLAVRAAIEEARAKEHAGSCPGVAVDSLAPSAEEKPATMPGPGEIWRPVPWIAGFAAAAAAIAIAAFVHVRPGLPAAASGPVAASRPVATAVAPPPEEPPPPPVEAPSLTPPAVDVDSLPVPAPVASAKRPHPKPKASEIVRTADF
ncbi:MAG TPA: serine/threonine-protein kinase [Polyangiaceae bacterium]